jgi:hypothetical protein
MKRAKQFDCVKMKDEIQAKLLKQWHGLSDEEIRQEVQRKLAISDSPLAKLWRSLQKPAAKSK